MVAGSWNLCAPLVWDQGFPTPLDGLSMSTNRQTFAFRPLNFVNNPPPRKGMVVSVEERSSLLYECLSSLLRLGSAFPNLAPIIARLLLSVGLMISSTLSDDSRSYMLCQLETLRASSQQETLNPGFVLLGTRQQGVPVILKELVLPDGFDPVSLSL
ncbi:unnamed protein product [Schistosoma curassoni]|uniref:Uncharacterized protein n=1 Tax=Schistosoma curassoni TaxID=6186 RepID=A0A183K7G3_9TREM|nr:unnamed protein product [Schistosoma curassoni]